MLTFQKEFTVTWKLITIKRGIKHSNHDATTQASKKSRTYYGIAPTEGSNLIPMWHKKPPNVRQEFGSCL